MIILGSLFVVILGAALGSFANVLVYRLKEESSILGRSRCPECKKTIHARHLVPVFSYLLLRGRCFFCNKKIHWQYPVVEAAAAVLMLIAFLRHAHEPIDTAWIYIAFEIILSFILLVIVTFDLRWQLIPLEFAVAGAMLLAVIQLFLGANWFDITTGAVFAAMVLGGFVLFSRGRLMGEGDPIVGLIMGVVLGFPYVMIGLLLSFLVGGAVATGLLLQGAVDRKTAVPFAPFLAAGMLIAVWWSEPLTILFGYALY